MNSGVNLKTNIENILNSLGDKEILHKKEEDMNQKMYLAQNIEEVVKNYKFSRLPVEIIASVLNLANRKVGNLSMDIIIKVVDEMKRVGLKAMPLIQLIKFNHELYFTTQDLVKLLAHIGEGNIFKTLKVKYDEESNYPTKDYFHEMETVKTENTLLKQENERLKQENERLKQENERLKQDNDLLKKEKERKKKRKSLSVERKKKQHSPQRKKIIVEEPKTII